MVKVERRHLRNIHDLCISNAEPHTTRKNLHFKRIKLRREAIRNKEKHEAHMFDYYHLLFKDYLISLLDTLKFLRDQGVDLNEVIDIAVNDDKGMSQYSIDVLEELNRIRDDNFEKQNKDPRTEERIQCIIRNYPEGYVKGGLKLPSRKPRKKNDEDTETES